MSGHPAEDDEDGVGGGEATVTVRADDLTEPERIDAYLARRLAEVQSDQGPDLSRSRLKALIDEGQVRIDGRSVTAASKKVQVGQEITIIVPAPVAARPEPEDIPLDIVYEDAELIVIDKPSGLVVHPGAGNPTGTLVNALLHHCKGTLSGIGGVERPGIVHRLDKDTTGLMVVAKTDRAHKSLAAQFADHGRTNALERAYAALVWGAPRLREGTLESEIGRDSRDRQKMAVVKSGGRVAITHYTVETLYGATGTDADTALASLVECRLETGRTHQIRVHMAAMRHPLLGDSEYGAGFLTKEKKLSTEARDALAKLGRQALHARLLAFEHPKSGKVMRFESELPDDMAALVEALEAM